LYSAASRRGFAGRPHEASSLEQGSAMSALPTGTVTFLFTDIEGSTHLWEQYPQAMQSALARHDAILRRHIESHSGAVFKTVGDAFYAAFAVAPDALAAAVAVQRALSAEDWGETGPLRVRVALHTGTAEERDADYFGPPLNRIARLLAAGHGGQVLLSLATQELVRDHLPPGVELRDLGEHRLKDLHRPERIFQVVASELAADFPPLHTLDTRPNNLPAQATPFIGREKEVDAVRRLMLRPDVRLLTLTGPGGTGKTRLGLQAAADLLDQFEDGVFFVPLAPIGDPGLVVPTVAKTLGVREAGEQTLLEGVKAHLRDQEMLLLLDNFEQVTAAAPAVSDLLASTRRLKVLVTSRAVLHVYGEHDFAVPPLTLPDRKHLPPVERLTQYEAVRLFIERAQALKADFAVTNENAPALAEICHRLDGLPLAIELAAARISLLSPQAILARLEYRLPMLTGGSRDLPARQRALRNTIDWSYDLLDEAEKTLFARVAVFVGSFSVEAAETVISHDGPPPAVSVLDGLTSLVDKSLLRYAAEHEAAGEPRLTMLETIREYALERLSAGEGVEPMRRRHAGHYVALAEKAEPELTGAQQREWLDCLEAEHDNLRAALSWALEQSAAEAAARLASSLWRFWYVRGYLSEGRRWLEQALTTGSALPAPLRAKALNGAGALAWAQGDYTSATALLKESLDAYRSLGDRRGTAGALNGLGVVAMAQGEYARAEAYYEESLALQREIGDRRGIAGALNNLGQIALTHYDYARAVSLYEESLELGRAIGERNVIALALLNWGRVAQVRGDYARSRALLEESLALQRELNDRRGTGLSLANLGTLALHERDFDRAASLYRESLALQREMGDRWGAAASLGGLGMAAFHQGDAEKALTLCEEALALLREVGDRWSCGSSLTDLGLIALEQGDVEKAAARFRESLELWRDLGDEGSNAWNLEGLAEVARLHGQPERAARLLGAAEALREKRGLPAPPNYRPYCERWVAAARAQLGHNEFESAWAEGCAMTAEQAMALALG